MSDRRPMCRSRFFVFALVAALLAAPSATAQTLGTEAFLASPAAQAYLDQRYEEALRLLEIMEARYPDDVTIKRLKGMALYNLERYRTAANTLRGVVALDPGNAAAQFWYGAALFKTGAVASAYRAFQQAVSLAPESAYGAQASKFIETIDAKTTGARRLSFGLTAGIQYDDNVSLTDSSKIDSARLFEQIDGRFLMFSKPGWSVIAEGGGYFSQNLSGGRDEFGNVADGFDLVSGNAGIAIVRETSAFGMPVTLNSGYRFELISEGYDRYADIHTLTTSLTVNPEPNIVTRGFYRFHKDYFAQDGFDPSISSRDGERHAAGIENYLYLSGNRHYIWAAYEYTWTDAQGVNFDARAHRISGGFSASLAKNLVLNGTAAYVHTSYPNFLGPQRRRSEKQIYSAELIRAFGDKLSLRLGYSYAFDDSNYSDLDNVRNLVTFSIKRSF